MVVANRQHEVVGTIQVGAQDGGGGDIEAGIVEKPPLHGGRRQARQPCQRRDPERIHLHNAEIRGAASVAADVASVPGALSTGPVRERSSTVIDGVARSAAT